MLSLQLCQQDKPQTLPIGVVARPTTPLIAASSGTRNAGHVANMDTYLEYARSRAELFLKRQVQMHLGLLKPSTKEHVTHQQAQQKKYRDLHAQDRKFVCGEAVMAQNFRDGPKWLPGKVLEQTRPASYKVVVNGQIWRCHVDQLRSHAGCIGEEESVSEEVNHEDFPKIPVKKVGWKSESKFPLMWIFHG